MVVQESPVDLVSSPLKSDKKHRLKQRFEIKKKLGQGTYGKVQLAINRETGQEVAIKTIKKVKIENEQDLIRIRREIQIMSSIQHPHIIHIYEVFENKDKIVLVMQFASGGELYDYLSEKKVLSDIEARRIFRQIAAAVYYCHKNKICHRDLKLENILLDEKGNAKIADFGLSNVFDEKHLLNTYCGSPLYASPEIVKGVPYYGPEVDCWSMGVLLYTLVYGAMPFDGSNFKKLVTQISEGDYFEPKKKSNASELIRKLLTVNPGKRATIVDICMDYWVNLGYEHCLLQVAEDMANLTPVRFDLLLALAPGSNVPQEESELNEQDEDVTSVNKEHIKDIPDEEEEEDEYNPDTAANSFSFMKGSHASQLSVSSPNLQEAVEEEDSETEFLPADIAAALQNECTKRLAESSFGASLARISSLAHRSKKPRKSDSANISSTDTPDENIPDVKNNKSTERLQCDNTSFRTTSRDEIKNENFKKSSSSVPADKIASSKNESSNENDNEKKADVSNQKSIENKSNPLPNHINGNSSDATTISQRKNSVVSEENADSKKVGRPPGKIIIPKTFESPQSSPSPKSVITKKPLKSENNPECQETNSETHNVAEESTVKEKLKPDKPNEDINKNIIEDPATLSKEQTTITEEQKNIAKGILKKGIARAKLAERRMSKQNSQESEASSVCSTPASVLGTPEPLPSFYKIPKPYGKEEETNMKSKAEIKLSRPQNSNNSVKSELSHTQDAPLWGNVSNSSGKQLDKNVNWSTISSAIDSDLSSWREQMEESLRRLSPDSDRLSSDTYAVTRPDDEKPLVPIARSYKKFTFTKDGACITETKKIYTTPGADGSWTKVEKKTKITTRPGNVEEFEKFRDLHLRSESPLTRSESQSSSGSNDIYDDIFDSWTGDAMLCNMRKMNSMFQKFSKDPFLRKERRRNPFRFFRRTESERNERERMKYEIKSGRSTDRESSENEEDYDVHFDNSDASVYGSQGLWQFLRSTNKDFPNKITIHHEPMSYGRSVSQDRSNSRAETIWKRSNSRASSGYNTGTRSQSRDRTESPREKVLRFVFESPRGNFLQEHDPQDMSSKNKWSAKKSGSRQKSRRDSGVGSDGYESEYSIRQCPSDELSRTGRVSPMSSVCSNKGQDMIRNFMKSWSKEFTSPPLSSTSLNTTKDHLENLAENKKHRVEQWLHMNSEAPFDFCSPGIKSRSCSTSHNNPSAYATMRPREYLQYNRSSSDKLPDSDADFFSSFEDSRMRSVSLNKDSSPKDKMRFRATSYSPVSEESFKEAYSTHRSDSSQSASSVHHINFTISDGRVSSSHASPQKRYAQHYREDGSVSVSSPTSNIQLEQVSGRPPGQPVVQMRVSFNRGNRENQMIHVSSQPPQPSNGLWQQQNSVRTYQLDNPPREPSPLPGIRQFSTEVQHSVGESNPVSHTSIECEINTGKKLLNSPQPGKNSSSNLPLQSSIWDMACSQMSMESNVEPANINLNSQRILPHNNIAPMPDKLNNKPKCLQSSDYVNQDSELHSHISNGANTPDSLEDLSFEQSLLDNILPVSRTDTDSLHESLATNDQNEFHVDVKPLGVLWNNCSSQPSSEITEKENNDQYVAYNKMRNFSPTETYSDCSEVPDYQKKCLENTTPEIGSIWNQKCDGQKFHMLKNLLSDDGLDSFSSSKHVINSCHVENRLSSQSPQSNDRSRDHKQPVQKHNVLIDSIGIDNIDHNEEIYNLMPSLMDDLQSPKEVLRQAMKICERFE